MEKREDDIVVNAMNFYHRFKKVQPGFGHGFLELVKEIKQNLILSSQSLAGHLWQLVSLDLDGFHDTHNWPPWLFVTSE